MPGLLDELRWRGLIHDLTPGLPARLASGRPIAGYNGFDPSGPSLHAGSLVPIFGLLHLQRHGGRPVVLVGGATGMIGDPSGRSSERTFLSAEELEANKAAIRTQLEHFVDFTAGPTQAVVVDNLDWQGEVRMLDFLRDVGKHFTVPYMLAKDSVQARLDRGLSFTEFSYMLLQASDYEHLYRTMGVELQMGGADQWGNITAGLELIRRTAGDGSGDDPAHGLCYPLLTLPSGEKFGKTADGTSVWLDPERTSPYAFYQHWLNCGDADVGGYLRFFTLLEREEIEALEAAQAADPGARAAQRAFARDLTARTHGEAAAAHAIAVSEAAFSNELVHDATVLDTLHRDGDGFDVTASSTDRGVAAFLAETGLAASTSEARRLIAGGAVTVNGVRISSHDEPVPAPLRWRVVSGPDRQAPPGDRATRPRVAGVERWCSDPHAACSRQDERRTDDEGSRPTCLDSTDDEAGHLGRAGCALLAGLMIACGPSPVPSASPAASPSPSPADRASSIRIGLVSPGRTPYTDTGPVPFPLSNMTPTSFYVTDGMLVRKFLARALYRLDSVLTPVPDLAAGPCSFSADGLAVTCTLTPATFSDGTALTADDVVHTYELAATMYDLGGGDECAFGGALGWCLGDVLTSVEAIDAATVRFHLSRLDPRFVTQALPTLVIDSKQVIEQQTTALRAAATAVGATRLREVGQSLDQTLQEAEARRNDGAAFSTTAATCESKRATGEEIDICVRDRAAGRAHVRHRSRRRIRFMPMAWHDH